ncbi:methyltransferase-like protein 25 isoform X3 [Vigna unguiculata]|uniref:methyltransferase-like protein 25 isoform X3 n=1 Tax=Vigna unguiculata TaxID=3917 RepID=UPI00101695AA|nr:methyltransferase-like protein 25 isoform X3 [Vigna unguiculata]XP_027920268.1 methyltransferase-like protein 25 isoform X3 [Vigna unguiculata]
MGECRYSCKSAVETLAWINDIIHFLAPYSSLIDAHVVNFFKDRLWENVDAEWIECLRREPVQNLLLIPSGAVQYEWPTSLKEFILKLRSMVFCQDQADMNMALPGLQMTSLNSVLAQGMNVKKKHEVEILSAVISTVAKGVRADAVADVGAGQGYLAQVLAFQYQHPVIAIDACSHHGRVTDARAARIKKYYTSQMIKSGSGFRSLNVPKTITCNVLSIDSLKTLVEISLTGDDVEQSRIKAENQEDLGKLNWHSNANKKSSIVLAGLHACGDLSVTMLKTFLECKDVKAVVSLGCCYNLLSEERIEDGESQCGFPMSHAARSTSLSLGKSARDLACQSAERWRSLDMHAGIHNFELHAFRAAFQMVLSKYYPEIVMSTPSIGRKGKALRRRHQRRSAESQLHLKGSTSHTRQKFPSEAPFVSKTDWTLGSISEIQNLPSEIPCSEGAGGEGIKSDDKFLHFENFCQSGLSHLGIKHSHDINLEGIWKEAEPFAWWLGTTLVKIPTRSRSPNGGIKLSAGRHLQLWRIVRR